ncbi:hypothetical protein ACIBO1_00370 [Micromonospora sp. NPDC049903]|uniref:hypothetical protein n=1 Tax=Micromonospora sp. NPDC049903 TaxID=3364276 RepID=UPI0037BAB368
MAEEKPARSVDPASHRTRSGRRRAESARSSTPAPTSPPSAQGATRAAARRLARARRRRRTTVEAVAALAGLLALVGYVSWWSEPTPDDQPDPDGLPAVVGRPALPSGSATADAVPGLRPRERSPSPSPSATVVSTPAPPTAPPTLVLSRSDIPATVDLTEAGRRDWLHWGLGGATSPVRKRDGSADLRDLGGRGDRDTWDGNQELFRWRDGAPVDSAGDVADGVYTCGAGNGFRLAVVSDGQPRTATVYLGVWMARGRLDVRVGDDGPRQTLRVEERHTSLSSGVTVRFQAPQGTRVLLTWTVEEAFTPHCGNVGLQAVALR